jgi:hypothetical protein
MDLLHKSKEDIKVDAALRSSEIADMFDIDSNDIEPEEEPLNLLSEELSTENSGCHQGLWDR